MNTDLDFLKTIKDKKIPVKVYLDSGTMLQGIVNNFNNDFIVLDKCLINVTKIISIAQ